MHSFIRIGVGVRISVRIWVKINVGIRLELGLRLDEDCKLGFSFRISYNEIDPERDDAFIVLLGELKLFLLILSSFSVIFESNY